MIKNTKALCIFACLSVAVTLSAGEREGQENNRQPLPRNVHGHGPLEFIQTNRYCHGATTALAARFVSSAWQKWREDASQASSMVIALAVGGIAGAATAPEGQGFSARDTAKFLLGFLGSYAGTIHFYPPVKNEAKKEKDDKEKIEKEIDRRVKLQLAQLETNKNRRF